MQVTAGTVPQINWSSGLWVFLDIGFANKTKSCGLLIHDGKPELKQFAEARSDITELAKQYDGPINLVVEAPLSVSFDKYGNPKGRSIEKRGSKTRYWYNGLGCAVMVGTLYLVRSLVEAQPQNVVRLFEGFISYKESDSDHLQDVCLLREVVRNPDSFEDNIISPKKLKFDESDQLESAFKVASINVGVPPIIQRNV